MGQLLFSFSLVLFLQGWLRKPSHGCGIDDGWKGRTKGGQGEKTRDEEKCYAVDREEADMEAEWPMAAMDGSDTVWEVGGTIGTLRMERLPY